jgi:hypothetical protein
MFTTTRKPASGRGRVAGLGLLLLAALGCGGGTETGEVTGRVTYRNKTVPAGTVTLLASNGKPYNAPIQADGSYAISNVPVGPAKLAVTSTEEAPARAAATASRSGGKGATRLQNVEEGRAAAGAAKSRIPLGYGDLSRSGLTVEVKGGPTMYNIALKD